MTSHVYDPPVQSPVSISRDDPRHPLYGMVNTAMSHDQMQTQRVANTERIKAVRTITPAKAEAMAKSFDNLQAQVIETFNKATLLLNQNQQMHQIVTVSRDVIMVAEKIAETGHLTKETAQELVQALRFLPPLEVIDQMILLYSN